LPASHAEQGLEPAAHNRSRATFSFPIHKVRRSDVSIPLLSRLGLEVWRLRTRSGSAFLLERVILVRSETRQRKVACSPERRQF